MQEWARQAIREYVEQHSRADLLERVLDEEIPRYAEACAGWRNDLPDAGRSAAWSLSG
jgi:hypothetical protein